MVSALTLCLKPDNQYMLYRPINSEQMQKD